jgi:predicted Zn-ribbon and HTH transcriptional regulator
MGYRYSAVCKKCGHNFEVSEGGGFIFHLLRCDQCGKTKSISFREIGEPHLQFLKGLKVPYCVATMDHDKFVRENYPGPVITRNKYHKIVEAKAGKCACGGNFKFKAKPRCPKCRATEIKKGETTMYYD